MTTRFAVSAATVIAAIALSHSNSLAEARQGMPPSAATRPAPASTEIPVKEVVIFSSGVGYFEHSGTVNGDAATELRFKTDQVNDILKSLILQDTDGGNVGTVSYPGLSPLAHTLKAFQVDIAANPDMADLLNQLRGAKITVTTDGDQKTTGVILGVEKKLRAAGDRAAAEVIKLNLKVDRQFRSVLLDQVRSMELDDAALQKELDEALASLVQARDQDKKPMTLHFNGKGERHVRIGYLVETPIWKTSYRLVLGSTDAEKKHEPVDVKGPTTAPASRATTRTVGELHHSAKIQGWAIVENQTDNDWSNVQLSLVSGRPLSFIQDLYHAQYIPRPVVQADNYASLRPQTYNGAIYDIKDLVMNVPDLTDAPDFSLNSTSNNRNQNPQGGGGIGGAPSTQPGGNGLFQNGGGMGGQKGQGNSQQAMDPTSSIISAATAARVGELFKYRIGSVSLARQTSAMIPIVTDDIDAERVSIYNAGVLATHPLLGARVRNNTRKYLLQGPITVLDQGSYAGDARLEDLPPGQERLISFGIDQQLSIDDVQTKQNASSLTGKIVKGVMMLTSRSVIEQTYVANNKSEDTRVLVIEHPRQPEFKLVSPAQAEETTPEFYRFRRTIQPHMSAKLTIVQEHIQDMPIHIYPLASADLAPYLKDVAIPQKVRYALLKAIQLKDQVTAINKRIAELKHQEEEMARDQGRVRENMRAVAGESDYHKRLMKKIDDEESNIEKLQQAVVDLQQAREATEKQLSDYVAGLTVTE